MPRLPLGTRYIRYRSWFKRRPTGREQLTAIHTPVVLNKELYGVAGLFGLFLAIGACWKGHFSSVRPLIPFLIALGPLVVLLIEKALILQKSHSLRTGLHAKLKLSFTVSSAAALGFIWMIGPWGVLQAEPSYLEPARYLWKPISEITQHLWFTVVFALSLTLLGGEFIFAVAILLTRIALIVQERKITVDPLNPFIWGLFLPTYIFASWLIGIPPDLFGWVTTLGGYLAGWGIWIMLFLMVAGWKTIKHTNKDQSKPPPSSFRSPLFSTKVAKYISHFVSGCLGLLLIMVIAFLLVLWISQSGLAISQQGIFLLLVFLGALGLLALITFGLAIYIRQNDKWGVGWFMALGWFGLAGTISLVQFWFKTLETSPFIIGVIGISCIMLVASLIALISGLTEGLLRELVPAHKTGTYGNG